MGGASIGYLVPSPTSLIVILGSGSMFSSSVGPTTHWATPGLMGQAYRVPVSSLLKNPKASRPGPFFLLLAFFLACNHYYSYYYARQLPFHHLHSTALYVPTIPPPTFCYSLHPHHSATNIHPPLRHLRSSASLCSPTISPPMAIHC